MERAALLFFLMFMPQYCQGDAAVRATFDDARCNGSVVCPGDPLLFTCTVTGSQSAVASVILPTGERVDLLRDNIIEIEGSLPKGITVDSHDVTMDIDGGNYVLTVAIERASLLNGSLVCDNRAFTPVTDQATCLFATAPPGPPVNLDQNVSANTETSADIYWQSPVSTGGPGVTISRYNVSVDGGEPEPVGDDGSDVITHTLSGLTYNTRYSVAVTANNSCGLSSPPANASVFIEARAPPTPSISRPVLDCGVLLKEGRPISISWTYGEMKEGVLYPGRQSAMVEVTPGGTVCSGVAMSDTSCTTNITNDDNYSINLTVSNDIGPSQPVIVMFDSTLLSAGNNLNSDLPNVKITVNPLCNTTMHTYEVTVGFGVRKETEDSCFPIKELEEISTDANRTYFVSGISLESGERYCYTASLAIDGNTVAEIKGAGEVFVHEPTIPTAMDGLIIGVGVALGIVLVFGVIIALIVILICIRNKNQKGKDANMLPLSSRLGPASSATKESRAGETVDAPTYQDPNTISRTPHPTTGELYTEVQPGSKSRKNKEQETGPMYQDPSTIEHETATSGDVYAMPQKKVKKGKKGKKEEEPELTEEQTAALYSVPDRKGQKAKSEGLTYADLDIHTSAKKAPPSAGSTYVDINYD
jgi:hypothetical protein